MTFGSNQADFLRDTPETVAQAVLTRLRLWVGEWFVDQTEGTPYQQAVLGMHTQQLVEPAMRQRILGTEGVIGIESFSYSVNADTRQASINAVVNTTYGTATVLGVM
jgi:hypothetical protein